MEDEDEEYFSPVEVLTDCSRSVESETASSKASTSSESSEDRHNTISAYLWPSFFSLWKKGPGLKIHALSSLRGAPKNLPKGVPKGVPKLTRRKTKRIRGSKVLSFNTSLVDADLCCLKSSWKNFALSELQAATDNFSNGSYVSSELNYSSNNHVKY